MNKKIKKAKKPNRAKNTTKEIWEQSAEKYASYQKKYHSAVEVLKKSLKGLKIKKNWDILDLACGPGNSTRFLSKQSPKGSVLGIDVSKKMIAIAKRDSENFSNIKYYLSPIEKFSTKKRFNLCVINFGIWFFKDQKGVMNKIYTLLKPKGLLLMTIPFPSNWGDETYKVMKQVKTKYHLGLSQRGFILLPIEELIENKFILGVWRIDSRPNSSWLRMNEFMEIPIMNSNIFKGGSFKKRLQAINELTKRMQSKRINPGYARWQIIILRKK